MSTKATGVPSSNDNVTPSAGQGHETGDPLVGNRPNLESTPSQITSFITDRIDLYESDEYCTDELLWDYLIDDSFQSWSLQMYENCNEKILKKFRDVIRIRGIYSSMDRNQRISKGLYDALNRDKYHEWTDDEVKQHLKAFKGRLDSQWHPDSKWNPRNGTNNTGNTKQSPEPQGPTPPENKGVAADSSVSHQPGKPYPTLETFASTNPERTTPNPNAFTDTSNEHRALNPEPARQTSIPPLLPPQDFSPPDLSHSRQIGDLVKIYSHAEKSQYGGEIDEVFNEKLRSFYNNAMLIGVPQSQYPKAIMVMLKGRALRYYNDYIADKVYDFQEIIQAISNRFETEEKHQRFYQQWLELDFKRIIDIHPDKTILESFRILLDIAQQCDAALHPDHRSERELRDRILSACRTVPECKPALYRPSATFEGVCADLLSTLPQRASTEQSYQLNSYPKKDEDHDNIEQFWTDRSYNGRGNYRGRGQAGRPRDTFRRQTQKKCYICNEPACWSTKHSKEERQKAYDGYRQRQGNRKANEPTYRSFLAKIEGIEVLPEDEETDTEQYHAEGSKLEIKSEDETFMTQSECFFTNYGEVDGAQLISILNDQTTYHAFTRDNKFVTEKSMENEQRRLMKEKGLSAFMSERYSCQVFQGIMPDSGAAGVSSAGEPQVRALQKLDRSITINRSHAGQHSIRFGEQETRESIGTIDTPTPLGIIRFHVLPSNTPFLLCLTDMDNMHIKFDNLENVLIQGNVRVPVIRKWGHAWMLLNQKPEMSIAWCHLTEVELRQIHRRFGHPSVQRLARILNRAGHEVESGAIKKLTTHCHQCQMNGKSPGRFKFSLKDDRNFNYEVIVDILYLDSKPVLQVVDEATSFQAARFLKDMRAKTVWDTLQMCWIDTYQGPPDYVVHDAGSNFASFEFRSNARAMAIDVKEVPVEAHHSIGKVERYHQPLRRAYSIISQELKGKASPENILQMAVKAVNDSAGPDGLVPTLLVFGAYPRMVNDSPPNPSIIERAKAIRLGMREVRKVHATRQVNDALGMRNGPNTEDILSLPINSDVRVYREKDKWTGPFKLLSTQGETCTIELPSGPTNFRSTNVKTYHQPPLEEIQPPTDESLLPVPYASEVQQDATEDKEPDTNDGVNKENTISNSMTRAPEDLRPRTEVRLPENHGRHPITLGEEITDDLTEMFLNEPDLFLSFLSAKEEADRELATKLRKEGKITTPGAPFEASDREEIDSLIARGIFEFKKYDPYDYDGIRLFKSRLVREIKGKTTETPYEKSRLVIQGYQDDGKLTILTQSPTIQRASQRAIIALAPYLLQNKGMNLWSRDISQAYTQSTTNLNRTIIARLPKEMEDLYPEGTIMLVIKPLYGIAEAGTHWWATYNKHHRERLMMKTSTYDPCFLITTNRDSFGIVGMQTDDTIILSNETFSNLEEEELKKAKFLAKPKEMLTKESPMIFNGCILTNEGENIQLRQKGQSLKINLIDIEDLEATQRYVEQRARGAYIASICQPEATFDLSSAAQHQNPTRKEMETLNKRLEWQIRHMERGLRYIPVHLPDAKIFVFVDGSFANNKDLSSQIGFEIILANETLRDDEFTITGNLLHWSSTKSKRVTRSVLASEIYGMVNGVDMAIAINSTLDMIMGQLELPKIPMIVCTDSYSLYECLVKLGTTKEKRLMIDIMALRQSYERREIFEIRWINGKDNPADAMTKSNPNKALETFVDANHLTVRVEGWVTREQKDH